MADLWWLMLALGTAVFIVFAIALAAGLFRRRRVADDKDDATTQTSTISGRWLAMGGVVVPSIIVLVVFVATIVAMRAVPNAAPTDALVVEVVGHQWWWEVRYPDEGVTTANEVHIPVGRPVHLRLSADDVIHSFWVPRLGGKIDMLPDRTNTLVLEADQPGEHHSQCAEFCGLGHANMKLTVVAETQEQFASWAAARRPPAEEPSGDLAARGLDVYVASECAECHIVRGLTPGDDEGPDLTHLASRPTLGAGVLLNTPENLAEWITNPHPIKPGVEMPATDLSEEDLDALLAYLEGLE